MQLHFWVNRGTVLCSVLGMRAALLSLLVGCASASITAPDAVARVPDAKTGDAPVAACGHVYSGVIATWSFAGELGSQAATPAATAATGMSAGSVSRSAALTAVSGASSINSSNWPAITQRDPMKYYTLSVTAPAG